MTHATYADLWLPVSKTRAMAYNVTLVLAGTVLLTLSAKISLMLPLSPVPVTLQTLAVLLIGALLGSRRGSLTVLAYLAEGAAGLPVFAKGSAGMAYLAGPTGGYLAGFAVAAFVTGYLAEKGWDRSFGKTVLAMLLGSGIILGFGVSWLSAFVGIRQAVLVGLMPFVVGDVVKTIAAGILLPSGWKILDRIGSSVL
jgi:biotin transport system substrate-specific component